MKLCRFNNNRLGVVEGDHVLDVTEALAVLPPVSWPFPPGDLLISLLADVRTRIEACISSAGRHELKAVQLHSPVANPTKICAAPVNYVKHLEEAIADEETFSRAHVRQIHETGLFLKANSSLIGVSQPVQLRRLDRRTDHEIELVVIIGKTANKVPRSRALDYVAGYTAGLDITLRGPEERSLRKSIDTYTVLGPWMVTADEIPDPGNLAFELPRMALILVAASGLVNGFAVLRVRYSLR